MRPGNLQFWWGKAVRFDSQAAPCLRHLGLSRYYQWQDGSRLGMGAFAILIRQWLICLKSATSVLGSASFQRAAAADDAQVSTHLAPRSTSSLALRALSCATLPSISCRTNSSMGNMDFRGKAHAHFLGGPLCLTQLLLLFFFLVK